MYLYELKYNQIDERYRIAFKDTKQFPSVATSECFDVRVIVRIIGKESTKTHYNIKILKGCTKRHTNE